MSGIDHQRVDDVLGVHRGQLSCGLGFGIGAHDSRQKYPPLLRFDLDTTVRQGLSQGIAQTGNINVSEDGVVGRFAGFIPYHDTAGPGGLRADHQFVRTGGKGIEHQGIAHINTPQATRRSDVQRPSHHQAERLSRSIGLRSGWRRRCQARAGGGSLFTCP